MHTSKKWLSTKYNVKLDTLPTKYISVMIIYQHWILKRFPLMYVPWIIIYLLKTIWWTHVLFWGQGYPCFRFLLMFHSGFQSQSGQTYSHSELLVWHLPTSWRAAWRPTAVSFPTCQNLFDFTVSRLAKVSLFPLLITSIKAFLFGTWNWIETGH